MGVKEQDTLDDDQVVRQKCSMDIFCMNLGQIWSNSCSTFGFVKNIYLGPPFLFNFLFSTKFH